MSDEDTEKHLTVVDSETGQILDLTVKGRRVTKIEQKSQERNG
jgi:hypothetical protein